MDEPYTYDAFISYSYRDKDRVHPIVDALKKRGLRVFLDTESIPVGESLTVALERALYRSNTLIVFLSRNSPRGSWAERELAAFRSLEGGRRRIIPVLLDDTRAEGIPIPLRDRVSLHWSGNPQDLTRLLDAVGVDRQELESRPKTPQQTEHKVEVDDRNAVELEITLGVDPDSFTIEQQEKFLSAIAEFLGMNSSDIKIKSKRRGSIKYEFSFTPEQAARLFFAITNGEIDELREFNLRDVRKTDASSRVFIGHGRSPLWRELKDFISERLRLSWDEFNREAVAGYTTTERLDQMLSSAGFAFLVMTGEDMHGDNTLHARENVIHEIGLFQGKLGAKRAIILVEEGCSEFSNIRGLTQLRFPKGNISAAFEEIRRVLEREQILA
jgi:predicted nucleotide-binding protein